MSIKTITQKLNEEKNKLGLVGGRLTLNEYDEAEHDVSAHISPHNWGIEINLKKGFNPVKDRRQKAYARKKNIADGLDTLVSDIFLHEMAHWQLPFNSERGCPYDTYNHDKIAEAVTDALPEDKKGQASYVANAFEDMLINPRVREYKGDFSGQVLFWDNEGQRIKEKGMKNYTAFYEAFVKLNMHLFGENPDKALLKRHYADEKKIDDAVKSVVQKLNLPANIKDTAQLFQKANWPAMAKVFAKELACLLDQAPQERLSAYSNPNQQGQGQGEKQQQPQSASGNGIEQKIGTKEGKEEIAYGRYAGGDRQSRNIESFEQLDSLYKRLSRDIVVRVESMTKDQSLNIAPLTYRPFDDEKDDLKDVKTNKLFVTDDGIKLGHMRQPLTIHSRAKIQKRSFPDFKMVMLDNSGSMKQSPQGSDDVGSTAFIPWGDKSKYHYALLGFYGIENYLQRQGIAQYVTHGLTLFSSSTRYKEAGFNDIDALRRKALSPEWGNTNLDAKLLLESLKGKESFVISISDGEIANWSSEKANFKKAVEKNHYAHIQIGGRSDFTNNLESWKMPVFYVDSGEKLSKLMVDITKDTYKRFTRI